MNGKSSTTSSTTSSTPVVDGTSGHTNVANLFSKNNQALLASNDTTDRSFLSSAVHSSLSVHDLCDISVSFDTVFAALSNSLISAGQFVVYNVILAHLSYKRVSLHAP